MNSLELIKKIKSGEIDPVENITKIMEKTKQINKEYNYFNKINEQAVEQAKDINTKGRLVGLPISIKDCICVKDLESTAGSKILTGYNPLFNATAVQKCIDQGAVIIGKTAQDEFGFGSFSVNTGLGFEIPLNPFDKERCCGGSSGGSGGITQKADFPHISLGESTGGSIEAPASFCGVIGFCPTYGRVSRYGLIDYANSLDKIGPMAKTFEEIALILEIISGSDKNESTSLDADVPDYSKSLNKPIEGMKIAIIKESMAEGVDEEIKDSVWKKAKELESKGAVIDEVSMPLTFKYGIQTYYLIAMSEASTNLAKYCGMRYGIHGKLENSFNEYFTKIRSKNLSQEAKRRIIIGTFARMSGFRDAYYLKAAKVRTRIIKEYKSLFKKYDCLLSPTTPTIAPKFKDIEKMAPLQNYMADIMTAGPNLAGIPHCSVPIRKEKMPIGIQIMADHLQEEKIIQLGSNI